MNDSRTNGFYKRPMVHKKRTASFSKIAEADESVLVFHPRVTFEVFKKRIQWADPLVETKVFSKSSTVKTTPIRSTIQAKGCGKSILSKTINDVHEEDTNTDTSTPRDQPVHRKQRKTLPSKKKTKKVRHRSAVKTNLNAKFLDLIKLQRKYGVVPNSRLYHV
uniref:Uncharacterized protein n=1 Tax=Euplotes harpa TaxID=151035 RepID=A0A7S3JEQ5_9SPIT